MELINYENIKDGQLEAHCSLLIAGYDTLPLQKHWKYRDKLFEIADTGVYDELIYRLSEQQLVKFLKYTPEFTESIINIVSDNINVDINKLIDLSLPFEVLSDIENHYPFVDFTTYVKQAYSKEQLYFIKKGIAEGLDVDFYLNYDVRKMSATLWVLSKNIEPDPEIFEKFSEGAIRAIYRTCERFNSYDVLQYVKDNPEVFADCDYDRAELFLVGKFLGILEPYEYVHLSTDELKNHVISLIKDRIKSIVNEEAKGCGVKMEVQDSDLEKYDYDKLSYIMLLHHKYGTLLPFFIIYNKDNKNISTAMEFWLEAGIKPQDCADINYLIKRIHNYDHYTTMVKDYVKKILKLDKLEKRQDIQYILRTLYKMHKDGFDISPFINTKLSSLELDITYSCLKQGKDIVTDMTQWAELKRNANSHPVIFSELTKILIKHDINLFPYVITALRSGTKPSLVETTLVYLRLALNATRYRNNEGEQREYAKSVDKLIQGTVYREKFFTYAQMKEIHAGIIKGVDVSKYANIDYPGKTMSVIMKGLEKNIDLTPYIKITSNRKTLKHILRILNRETPISLQKMQTSLNNLSHFKKAVNAMHQENNKRKTIQF